MSAFEKAKQRLMRLPKDYTFLELTTLLTGLGFELQSGGRTSGSRRSFTRKCSDETQIISLHEPHPGNQMKMYAVKQVYNQLCEYGDLEGKL